MVSEITYSRGQIWQKQLAYPLSNRVRKLLVCLLSLDALFITIHMLILAFRYFGVVAESDMLSRFHIERDRSFPEMYNYFKLTVVSILLVVVYLRSRASTYLILAACFGFACLDDALQIHEQLSYYLAERLASIASQATLYHVIQPFYFAAVGIVFISLLIAVWSSNEPAHRQTSLVFVILLCVLAFFSAGVDLIKLLLRDYSPIVNRLVGLIEDSGEMVVITLSCGVAIEVFLRVRYNHSQCSRSARRADMAGQAGD